jgi:glycosyltransferase involved in cell wall biosynthesis
MRKNQDFILISRSALVSGAEIMLSRLASCLIGIKLGGRVECVISNTEVEKLSADADRIDFIYKKPLVKISKKPIFLFFYAICGFLSFFKLFFIPRTCRIIFNDIESLVSDWPLAVFRRSYFYLHDSHKLDRVKGRSTCLFISFLVDKILVVTRSRVKKLEGIGVANAQYFPNCVLVENALSISEGDVEKSCLRGRYKAVAVGQITSWKRIDKSIELVDKLNEAGVPVDLEIYGRPDPLSSLDAEYFLKIQMMCAESGFSKLLGYTEDLRSIYREADMFISMSANEPFGLALVEALSYGVPAIAMEGEGPDEILSAEIGLLLSEGFKYDEDLIGRVKDVISMSSIKCKERASLYSYEIYRERVECEFKAECPI